MTETETATGTVQSPPKPPLRSPTLVTFDTEPALIQYLVIPQLRNRLWREGPILDGLYEEFADYVSAPLDGRFDVVLVDGRARTSCLKRVHHDHLLAPGGVLFLHDADRPSQQEGLQLFSTWSYVRGAAFRTKTRQVERKARRFLRSGREGRCRTSRRCTTGSCTSTSHRSRTTRPGEDWRRSGRRVGPENSTITRRRRRGRATVRRRRVKLRSPDARLLPIGFGGCVYVCRPGEESVPGQPSRGELLNELLNSGFNPIAAEFIS